MSISTIILTYIQNIGWKTWLISSICSFFYGVFASVLHEQIINYDYRKDYMEMYNRNKKTVLNKNGCIDTSTILNKEESKNDDNEFEKNKKLDYEIEKYKSIMIHKYMSNTLVFFLSTLGFFYSFKNMFFMIYEEFTTEKNESFKDDLADNIVVMLWIQGLFWDVIIGYEFYPITMKKRLNKTIFCIIGAIIAYRTQNLKIYTLSWITEFPNIAKYYISLLSIKTDQYDQNAYYYLYAFFMIVEPVLIMNYLYRKDINFSIGLQFMSLIYIWFEFCTFAIWTYDRIMDKKKNTKLTKISCLNSDSDIKEKIN